MKPVALQRAGHGDIPAGKPWSHQALLARAVELATVRMYGQGGEFSDCAKQRPPVALAFVAIGMGERGARIRRVKWVELSCMLCGEWVATLEAGTVLRPRSEGSARVAGARVVCGRCGGALTPTDQGERVTFV